MLSSQQVSDLKQALRTIELLLQDSFIEGLCVQIGQQLKRRTSSSPQGDRAKQWLNGKTLLDFVSPGSAGQRLIKNREALEEARSVSLGGSLDWLPEYLEDALQGHLGYYVQCRLVEVFSDTAKDNVETLIFDT